MTISQASAQRTTTTVHTGVRLVLWLIVAGFAAWALVRVFGLDRFGGPLFPLVAFTPYVAVGALAVVGLATALRAWWPAAVAGVVAIALLVCVVPRGLAAGGGAGSGPRLRVLSSNMMIGSADAGAIVDLVRRNGVQLLAVQEFTPEAERALDAAGLADLLPHRVSYPEPGAGGSGLFSRFPLRDDGLRTLPSGFTQATATIGVPGAVTVAVESAHPCAPLPPDCSRIDLSAEPPASPDGVVRVLIGDFNATLDHVRLRQLIETGYRDAASVRGRGFTASWPYDGRSWIPGVTIDHVLADRRVGVTGYDAYQVPGSDHRAIYTELVLPGP
ncbi:endonuclease [Planosporangium mesophilum]|uniref:Endonuclease n=1 Tax=Planosporangium mesophilum TaxID=689768 RepID=A0A8J3T6T3_9ACTN|nr:endonuclease/exonuclease/phosphatase family protein [Planosporangium mesophilum]GII20723.1 endonuclease [Planosporangium mesophilum]